MDYITFRAGIALALSLFIAIVIGGPIIRRLRIYYARQGGENQRDLDHGGKITARTNALENIKHVLDNMDETNLEKTFAERESLIRSVYLDCTGVSDRTAGLLGGRRRVTGDTRRVLRVALDGPQPSPGHHWTSPSRHLKSLSTSTFCLKFRNAH